MNKILLTLMLLLSFSNYNVCNAENIWDVSTGELIATKKDIVVYRSPTCGCCSRWLAHLKKHDFIVIDNIVKDTQGVKAQYGISPALASCHTAIIDGHVVEGHVPASDIKRMLKSEDSILGLTVPGMVTGTPGMEMGSQKSPFKVIAFDEGGDMEIYTTYDKY